MEVEMKSEENQNESQPRKQFKQFIQFIQIMQQTINKQSISTIQHQCIDYASDQPTQWPLSHEQCLSKSD